jgi:hypothetical protein
VCGKVCRTLRADMRQYALFRYFFRALPCGLGCGQVIDLLAPIGKTPHPELINSGTAYRGSNPWGATKPFQQLQRFQTFQSNTTVLLP